MDKILPEQRRMLGNFELIDLDEATVKGLREQVDVKVPVDLHWTWGYASEVEELRRLYEKGKKGQWDAQTDLDWSIPVSKDDWLLNIEGSLMANVVKLSGGDEATQKAAMFDEIGYQISQLLHGEQAALPVLMAISRALIRPSRKHWATRLKNSCRGPFWTLSTQTIVKQQSENCRNSRRGWIRPISRIGTDATTGPTNGLPGGRLRRVARSPFCTPWLVTSRNESRPNSIFRKLRKRPSPQTGPRAPFWLI